jgi:hypothetical protein
VGAISIAVFVGFLGRSVFLALRPINYDKLGTNAIPLLLAEVEVKSSPRWDYAEEWLLQHHWPVPWTTAEEHQDRARTIATALSKRCYSAVHDALTNEIASTNLETEDRAYLTLACITQPPDLRELYISTANNTKSANFKRVALGWLAALEHTNEPDPVVPVKGRLRWSTLARTNAP